MQGVFWPPCVACASAAGISVMTKSLNSIQRAGGCGGRIIGSPPLPARSVDTDSPPIAADSELCRRTCRTGVVCAESSPSAAASAPVCSGM